MDILSIRAKVQLDTIEWNEFIRTACNEMLQYSNYASFDINELIRAAKYMLRNVRYDDLEVELDYHITTNKRIEKLFSDKLSNFLVKFLEDYLYNNRRILNQSDYEFEGDIYGEFQHPEQWEALHKEYLNKENCVVLSWEDWEAVVLENIDDHINFKPYGLVDNHILV